MLAIGMAGWKVAQAELHDLRDGRLPQGDYAHQTRQSMTGTAFWLSRSVPSVWLPTFSLYCVPVWPAVWGLAAHKVLRRWRAAAGEGSR